MPFNPAHPLGHRGEPLGACSDLLPPCGDAAVGSEGEISPTQVGEEVRKRQVMGGRRGAVCRECFASPWAGRGCHTFPWLGAPQPLSSRGRLMVGNVSAPGKEVCSLTAEGFFIFQTISYLGRFGKCCHACERRKQDKASREQGLADWELHHQMYVPCPCVGLLK